MTKCCSMQHTNRDRGLIDVILKDIDTLNQRVNPSFRARGADISQGQG